MKRNCNYNFAWGIGAIAALALAISDDGGAGSLRRRHHHVPAGQLQEGQLAGEASGFRAGIGNALRRSVDAARRAVPRLQPQGEARQHTYMVPLKDLDAHKNFETLGGVAAGMKINHTDIQYNPGHPGVEEPHYHIVQWLISPAAVKAEMK